MQKKKEEKTPDAEYSLWNVKGGEMYGLFLPKALQYGSLCIVVYL